MHAHNQSGFNAALGEMHRRQKRRFLSFGLSCLSDDEFVGAVDEAIQTGSRLTVSFLNPDYALRAQDPTLNQKINAFDIVLPDGWGIVLGARLLGLPVLNRQGNDDICPKVFALSAQKNYKNFLFGSAPGIVERASANLQKAYPRLPVVGAVHGYWDVLSGHPGWFEDEDNDRLVREINRAQPDILHVGLPTPIQQNWVWKNVEALDVPVIITGGSYLDHLAERIQWYPTWINKFRLGWAYRLYREPRRLWKRYSLDLLSYGRLVLKAKLADRRNR
jgi:N-acetylglucosaminyldiphosphoundecaprenol N-acetyl-beta-D-mannosaminyltransferase